MGMGFVPDARTRVEGLLLPRELIMVFEGFKISERVGVMAAGRAEESPVREAEGTLLGWSVS